MEKMCRVEKKYLKNAYIANTLVWMLILCLPYLSHGTDVSNLSFTDYLLMLRLPVTVIILFYVDYYSLVDRYLLKDRILPFIGINLILILFLLTLERMTAFPLKYVGAIWDFPAPPYGHRPPGPTPFHFVFVDFLMYLCALGAAVAFRMTRRWYLEEERKKEQEHDRTRTELQNLKNQLNPHFLFNVMNNIYSSIGTDSGKARKLMDSLCELLRYVLYRSEKPTVAFKEEVSFIRDYIELVKNRMPEDSVLSVSVPDEPSDTPVAPMLFIPLVENAFKHGVRPGGNSHVDICVSEYDGRMLCRVENSLYEDAEGCGKGGGIGMENLRKRLEIMYSGRYILSYGAAAEGRYRAYLEIDTFIGQKYEKGKSGQSGRQSSKI